MGTTFTGNLAEFLTVQELLDLSSLYGEILRNSDQMVELAAAFRMPIAEVYAEIIAAQKKIAKGVMKKKVK